MQLLAPASIEGLVSDRHHTQEQGPTIPVPDGLLGRVVGILGAQLAVRHGDVEGEDDTGRAFGGTLSSAIDG
eukprot:10833102-Prorocentrum_lima.AAC.1